MSRKSFRVGKSKTGLGLFATRLIPKGEFIVQYRGRKLTNAVADALADKGNKYLYELNSRWTIDGANRKNVARYANHSCRPNAESDVLRGHRIIIRSIKKIQPGEEILYDYGKDYFNLILKPIGCKCDKCEEKRREERALARKKAARKAARKAKAKTKAKTPGKAKPATKSTSRSASSRTANARAAKSRNSKSRTGKGLTSKSRTSKAQVSKTKVSKARASASRASSAPAAK
jgi:hypothetical protein